MHPARTKSTAVAANSLNVFMSPLLFRSLEHGYRTSILNGDGQAVAVALNSRAQATLPLANAPRCIQQSFEHRSHAEACSPQEIAAAQTARPDISWTSHNGDIKMTSKLEINSDEPGRGELELDGSIGAPHGRICF